MEGIKMFNGEVFSIPESDEYYFDEGCFILELMNSPLDQEVSIARARVEAGCTTRLHCLNGLTERYVIQNGEGKVTVGDSLKQKVIPGDVVLIPNGVAQKITNTGQEDLVFLAICSPRFTRESYQDLDDK